MADDLLSVLTKFHREIVMPDVKRAIDDAVGSAVGGLRNDMNAHFDDIYKRFDRLESEYQSLKAAVIRLEARMTAVETRLTRIEERLTALEVRLAAVESELSDLRQRLAAVEESLAGVRKIVDENGEEETLREKLQSEVDTLKEKLAELERRVGAPQADPQLPLVHRRSPLGPNTRNIFPPL